MAKSCPEKGKQGKGESKGENTEKGKGKMSKGWVESEMKREKRKDSKT